MAGMKDIKGKLFESYGRVKIFEGFPHNLYEISTPSFSEKEKALAEVFTRVILREGSINELQRFIASAKLLNEFRSEVIQPIDMSSLTQRLPKQEEYNSIREALLNIVGAAIVGAANVPNVQQLVDYILSKTIGYREISEMLLDDKLEEIMVNGYDRNIFVFHRHHGMCKTNIIVKERGFISDLIMRIAQTVNKQFNEMHPLLDARLPDGSRANATFSYVTPFGHSLTIRKFSRTPLSVIHMIENNTLTPKLAAFLWAMVEGLNVDPMNVIITGGAGSGKTTLMNVLSSFIPYSSRIISIEDTLELDLGNRENWIQMESKPALKDLSEVTMDELLKNALRMRPDRIIVGEVRGEEAQTLFVAMDTGHRGILGTLHSNTAREMLLRLKSKPMAVPESMLPLLDLAIVMQRTYSKKEGMQRRIKQVAEVSRMEEKVLLSNIFELNPKKDLIEKTDVPSRVIEVLAERAGMAKNDLNREILVRQRILEWMMEKRIKNRPEVEQIIQQYYFEPSSVLEQITKEL